MDAIDVAGRFGIEADRAVNYECDARGTEVNFRALCKAVSRVRSCDLEEMPMAFCDWIEEIEADYMARHK